LRSAQQWPGLRRRGVTRANRLPAVCALKLRSAPPALGEHSRAVLHDLGYDDAQWAALFADGVVGQAQIPD
jgi:crotonobetainyl-CoA:carnitine CoA-transferase CaiB-like acyl-CoA transferase